MATLMKIGFPVPVHPYSTHYQHEQHCTSLKTKNVLFKHSSSDKIEATFSQR